MSSLKEIMDGLPNKQDFSCAKHDDGTCVLVVSYAKKGYGFGEIVLIREASGSIRIDTETSGKEFAKEIINRLIDEAEGR